MKRRFLSIILLFLLSVACSMKDKDFSKIETVRFSQGSVKVEIADDDTERGVGLMFRESMASNAGMLFIFDKLSKPSFYMKNTAIPLDIIFINKEMKVVTIKQMNPFDEKTLHGPAAEVQFALEVNKGWAERHGVKEGDETKFIIPKGKSSP